MDHSPKRHDEHKYHRDNNKPNRTSAPPQVKCDHEKRQPGEQLVCRAEEGPKDEPTLPGVCHAPLGSTWRHSRHGGGDDDSKDRCAMLILQHSQRPTAKRGGQLLHDVALQTAGGIKHALPLLGDEPFLVINGDIFIDYLPDVSLAYRKVIQAEADAFLWLVDNPAHHPQGDFAIDVNGQLTVDDEPKLTFAGLGIYHPRLFINLPEGKQALGPLLKQSMSQQRIQGVHFKAYWCDVGTIERLEQLQSRLLAQD